MTTFSQMVDDLTKEFVRPDLEDTNGVISAYLNQTIREVHTGSQGQRYKFDENCEEFSIDVPTLVDNQFIWPIANFNRLQLIESVWLPLIGRWSIAKRPRGLRSLGNQSYEEEVTHYQSGDSLVIRGVRVPGDGAIRLSAYYYPRSLVYRTKLTRWASYSDEDEAWTYHRLGDKPAAELEALSTNWLIQRWPDLLKEGVRAKVYKRLGDQLRMTSSYSAYQQIRNEMQSQESGKSTQSFQEG